MRVSEIKINKVYHVFGNNNCILLDFIYDRNLVMSEMILCIMSVEKAHLMHTSIHETYY
jgi:hypothetical protein